ncbi:RsmE family RNA methyltransferase [Thalassoroseus pseudoceratinae]|uniref:RsmE family RNA methyltransferase n=1 Tax=Thalassoroseus pseudoceratinae TaxID=2713176 RepID=UPI00141ED5EB|nr:RsmE family RNA methyltransferase [Thalassoroseus pseudoceratinae]
MDRFFAAELDWNAPSVTLDEMEARHLSKVLRKNVGEMVEVFDGNGRSVTASVERIEKRKVTLQIDEKLPTEPITTPTLTLAVAPPKGDRFRWLVEKATELGVDQLIPLETRRGVVNPRDGKLDKMRQTVIAACKQSRRNRLMEITAPTAWDELLEKWVPKCTCWVAHPTGTDWQAANWETDAAEHLIVIGPEGGLTNGEVDQAMAAGATPISLGPRILRIETAALAVAAVFGLNR